MTDADKKRIFEACGWLEDPEHGWGNGQVSDKELWEVKPTQQERWEALCRVWGSRDVDPGDKGIEQLLNTRPILSGDVAVLLWEPGGFAYFTVKEYGSLNTAIDAAILFVLDRKEGGE